MKRPADAENLLRRRPPLHGFLNDPLHIGFPNQGLGRAVLPVPGRLAQLFSKQIDGRLKIPPVLNLLKIAVSQRCRVLLR